MGIVVVEGKTMEEALVLHGVWFRVTRRGRKHWVWQKQARRRGMSSECVAGLGGREWEREGLLHGRRGSAVWWSSYSEEGKQHGGVAVDRTRQEGGRKGGT